MVAITGHVLRLILLLMFARIKCEFPGGEMSERLDEMLLGMKTQRYSRDVEKNSKIWQEYEFGSGVGNRDELMVTNISVRGDQILPNDVRNWQFLAGNGMGLLAGSGDSIISLYRIGDPGNPVVLTVDGKILTFKIINLPKSDAVNETVVVISCVESNHKISLQWYELSNEKLVWFWSWPVHKTVNRLEFFRHNGQNKLLLLNEATHYMEKTYSAIEVYGFDHTSHFPDFWLCQRLWIPKTHNFLICPIYENTVLMLQNENNVLLYEYKDSVTKEGLFELSQNITSNGLRNSICFESGHMQYLATSGPEPALFKFIENEFVYDDGSEKLFNDIGEISWIQNIPVDSYREESLLLIQLKNSSVIGLTWQGHNFKIIPLPKMNVEFLDLSKIIPVQKFGFVFGNKLIKIDTKLRDLPRPVYDEMERMLRMKNDLEVIFQKQELLLDETETLIDNSYYKNPRVTGFWDLSNVASVNATISDAVQYQSVTVGSKNLTSDDIDSNVKVLDEKLNQLTSQINEIDSILNNSVPIDSTEVRLEHDTEISGNFDIRETLDVRNLTLDSLNGVLMERILNDFVKHDNKVVIAGRKSFPSIEFARLNCTTINGVPVSKIVFDDVKRNYENVNFSQLNQLMVEGNLNLSTVNGIVWEDLMKGIVLKSHRSIIPGRTVIVNGEIVADVVGLDNLNRIKYPEGYILQNSTRSAYVTGNKSFDKLTVANLVGIKNINGVPFGDFVTLNTNQTLTNEITFENLIIDERLQIDGEITGVDTDHVNQGLTLKDTNVITSDTIFTNLYVAGNLIVEKSVNGKKWSNFDDVLLKTEDNAEITGKKTFLGDVKIDNNFVITSGRVNGHLFQEFVTSDTAQEFPNLDKISTAITCDRLKHEELSKLEHILKGDVDENGNSKCLQKKIVFNESPILDQLDFNTLNSNITSSQFSEMLNQTLQDLHFENLDVKKLLVTEIVPNTMNGVNMTSFDKRRISLSGAQSLSGDFVINNLAADRLKTKYINGMSLKEFEELREKFGTLVDRIFTGKMPIESLTVTGTVRPTTINGRALGEIYPGDGIRNVVFEDDAFVENLRVNGLINGLDLAKYVSDSVLKTETHVHVTGAKTFDRITCQILDAAILNGHPVETILNPERDQILTGPVIVKGSVIIDNTFGSDGNINDVPFDDLVDRLKYLGNNTFELHGNFRFVNNVTVKDLHVNGPINGMPFDSFTDTIILKRDDVVVSGSKIFQNSVTFGSNLVITEKLNDVDLKQFDDRAVFLDKDIEIESEIVFEEDVILREDLVVREILQTGTMKNVDVDEMKESAIFLNRSTFVSGSITFANASFESPMTVENLNNIDANSLMPLHLDQIIMEPISATNLYVEKLDVGGGVNGYDLNEIQADTLTLTGEQNVTGYIMFHGNVHVRQNFNAPIINGLDMSKIIPLDGNDTLIVVGTEEASGWVMPDRHVKLDELYIQFSYSHHDPLAWEAIAVYDVFPTKQIVSGNWIVHGDVVFEKDVLGSGLLNELDVKNLATELKKQNLEIEVVVGNSEKVLESICQDLMILQQSIQKQIYKFKYFEYLQIFDFEQNVVSAHHFEFENYDYLLINLESCYLDAFVFNGSEFVIESRIPDFGLIENWITLIHENNLYFLTVGRVGCGRNAGNLWKFEDRNLIHISDLGNVTTVYTDGHDTILALSDNGLEKWSIDEIRSGSYRRNAKSYLPGNERMKFISNNERILIADENFIHEFDSDYTNVTSLRNHFGTGEILSFRAGIFETEMFLRYDQRFSEKDVFIHDSDLAVEKIQQIIHTHKPKSFLVLNFDGFTETFLTFVENERRLQVYEYRGIEGFVHRETLNIQAERTFGFKLRKYPKLSRRNCIGAVHKNQLIVLEARMYGERLDADDSICEN